MSSVSEEVQPLHKNRNYTILWASRFSSEIAGEVAYLAFPLLVLSSSRSAWELGAVASVYGAAQIVGVIPAGVLADKVSRTRIMIVSEILRILVVALFLASFLRDGYNLWLMLAVVAVEGALSAAFAPAEDAALPTVVHESQLVSALARNTSRTYLAALLGPAVCGALFSFRPQAPFGFNMAVLALSLLALSFLRLPPTTRLADLPQDDARDGADRPPAGDFAPVPNVLQHRALRASVVWVGLSQLLATALVILVLSRAGETETPPGEIGFMMTFYGAGGLTGSVFAERVHNWIKPSLIVIGFSWVIVAVVAAMDTVPTGIPLGLLLGLVAFFIPMAFTAIMGYQLAITPEGERGRLSAILGIVAGLATTVGPLLGAALISTDGRFSSFMTMAGLFLVVAVWATRSPSLRQISRPGATA